MINKNNAGMLLRKGKKNMYDKLKNKNLFNMDETMAADIFEGT